MSLTYRWLGVAGLELICRDYTLLVDPFFTRPPKRALIAGARVRSNEALVERYAPQADAVLVTHPHYDHLLDVPAILHRTGGRAYGSPNTCALLAVQGIPAGQTSCIHEGDQFSLGPFQVTVHPARHTPIPFPRQFNGPLPGYFTQAAESAAPASSTQRFARLWLRIQLGLTRSPAQAVLRPRLTEYRMDASYSFHIQAEGNSLLIGNAPVPANGLFISPYHPMGYLENVLRAVRPLRVVLIHWEDFTLPLGRPLKPMLLTPAQGLRPRFPPVQRVNLPVLAEQIQRLLPGVEVEIPTFNQLMDWPQA